MRKLFSVLCIIGLVAGCGEDDGSQSANNSSDAADLGDAEVTDADVAMGGGRDGAPDAGPSDRDAANVPDAAACVPNDMPDLCDGVDNDCDPNTADGADEPTLAQKCDGADTDACNEGSVQCMSGALVCSDTTGDAIDFCDGLDNDCDGQTDEACTAATFSVQDFAVDGTGASVAVGVVGNKVRMMCFGPDGSVVRDAFDAASPDNGHNIFAVAVARSQNAGNIAVVFSARPKAADNRIYIVFYDRQCQPLKDRQVLDSDYANAGPTRQWTLAMTDDGRGYALYENYDAAKMRALVFDASGTRTASATLSRPSECAGDQRTGVLALDASSGAFAVVCETNVGRAFRRFSADGSPLDMSMRAVPDAQPDGFSFNYWGAAMNRRGELLYFGRVGIKRWIFRPYQGDGTAGALSERDGLTGLTFPRAVATSTGHFLIQQAGDDQQLVLVDPLGAVVRSFATAPMSYRLDAEDNVYVLDGNAIVRSQTVSLR